MPRLSLVIVDKSNREVTDQCPALASTHERTPTVSAIIFVPRPDLGHTKARSPAFRVPRNRPYRSQRFATTSLGILLSLSVSFSHCLFIRGLSTGFLEATRAAGSPLEVGLNRDCNLIPKGTLEFRVRIDSSQRYAERDVGLLSDHSLTFYRYSANDTEAERKFGDRITSRILELRRVGCLSRN